MRWLLAVALAVTGCSTPSKSEGQARGTGSAHGSATAGARCAHDPEPCPGVCNDGGYCEHDFGWGSEVRVPAATYAVAYRDPKSTWDEIPALVTFPHSYWIAKRETTVEQYRRCIECPPLDGDATPEMPVTVPRAAAVQFCTATGRRLPTNAEWEAAARGPSPCTDPALLKRVRGKATCNFRWFPWADDDDELCERAHTSECVIQTGPRPVAPHPEGASPLGVEELTGNVAEWIEDFDGKEPLVKGWGWQLLGDDVSERMSPLLGILVRFRRPPSDPNGVRCVRGDPMKVEHRPRPI